MVLRNPLLGGRRPDGLGSEGPQLLVLIKCDIGLVVHHRNDQARREEGIDEVTIEVPHHHTTSVMAVASNEITTGWSSSALSTATIR
ncbi:hypothetical protein D3C75_1151730 [compost metagenome]